LQDALFLSLNGLLNWTWGWLFWHSSAPVGYINFGSKIVYPSAFSLAQLVLLSVS